MTRHIIHPVSDRELEQSMKYTSIFDTRFHRDQRRKAFAPHVAKPSLPVHKGGCGRADIPVTSEPIAWGSVMFWLVIAMLVIVGAVRVGQLVCGMIF